VSSIQLKYSRLRSTVTRTQGPGAREGGGEVQDTHARSLPIPIAVL
jgi:hypothetical protein